MAQIRIDGHWATEIAAWGDLSWVTQIRGGMHEITWSMDVDTSFRHPALRTGALVEVFDGPSRIGSGPMNEPDMASGTFVARGLYRLAENFMALDGAGAPTSIPDTAIDRAILAGLPWTRPASLSVFAFGANPPDEPFRLSGLLDQFSDSSATYWSVNAAGQIRQGTPVATPTWYLQPGLTDLGLAEDDYASDLYGRRLVSGGTFATTTRGDAVARAAFERREDYVDLTSLGVITVAQANAVLDGLLAKGRARPSFTDSIEVARSQLLTADGVPADLSMVQAGQMVRSHGFYDDISFLNGATYLDWLIGETKYGDGSDVITLSPQGLAPRDLASVLSTLPARGSF